MPPSLSRTYFILGAGSTLCLHPQGIKTYYHARDEVAKHYRNVVGNAHPATLDKNALHHDYAMIARDFGLVYTREVGDEQLEVAETREE